MNWLQALSLYLLVGITFQMLLHKGVGKHTEWTPSIFCIAVFAWPVPVAVAFCAILYRLAGKEPVLPSSIEKLDRLTKKLQDRLDGENDNGPKGGDR